MVGMLRTSVPVNDNPYADPYVTASEFVQHPACANDDHSLASNTNKSPTSTHESMDRTVTSRWTGPSCTSEGLPAGGSNKPVPHILHIQPCDAEWSLHDRAYNYTNAPALER